MTDLTLVAILPIALLVCLFLVAKRRARGTAETEVPREVDALDVEELQDDLDRAKSDGDQMKIEAIEDQLRIHEYWQKKAAGFDLPDRVKNEPSSISDWNTSEKRFNNFR